MPSKVLWAGYLMLAAFSLVTVDLAAQSLPPFNLNGEHLTCSKVLFLQKCFHVDGDPHIGTHHVASLGHLPIPAHVEIVPVD